MGQNEKIRTEDVISILDGKILTSEGHPDLGVVPLENYDSVLSKIAALSLTTDQKDAISNTLTTPSASNPVVLKDDLQIYVPQADLGDIKDSVATFSLLPLPVTLTASTSVGSQLLTAISPSTTGLYPDQLVTDTGGVIPAQTVVVSVVNTTTIKLSQSAISTASDISVTFSPLLGELRGVISDGIIYRWNGTDWIPFIKTGTLDHTQLVNQNGDANYQHLTLTEKTTLLGNTHSHSNKAILDAIVSPGSGAIITTQERASLPTANQKDALSGTSGNPSALNPYVTNQDPRLNTVRNPYVTIGPPGSLASFQGVDFRPFEDAISAITIGTASAVKAIEVLPGFYTLGGVTILWSTQGSALLLENMTPGTATLSFQTFQAGIKALLPGTGPLIVKGFIFELNDLGTSGILSQRPNTLIEDCVFRPGPTTSSNQLGIALYGAGSVVRRCVFLNQLTKGVEIHAPNCRVTDCQFNLTNPNNFGIDVYPGGDYAFIDNNYFLNACLNVQASVNNTGVYNNYFASVTGAIDAGNCTRILENQPQDVNQPYIGRRRTIGPPNSYADYRGTTEAVFTTALADANAIEFDILEGTYSFGSTVSVPAGRSFRGVQQGASSAVVLESNGASAFILDSDCTVENLSFINTGAGACLETVTGVVNSYIKRCYLNTVSDYAVELDSPVNCGMIGCSFSGAKGLNIVGGTRTRIYNNWFYTTGVSFTNDLSSTNEHLVGNWFTNVTTPPQIKGIAQIIEKNHFYITPTKVNTSNSVWQGNWPHPEANNDAGADTLDLSLSGYLEPTLGAVARGELAGSGTLSFANSQVGAAGSLPVALPGRLNRALGYAVNIYWTSTASSGDVNWRVTVTFRDRLSKVIGTSVTRSASSTRTGSTSVNEDLLTINFTNLQYGLPSGVDPTHISVVVERVGTDPSDTLVAEAHLTELELLLPRD